MDVAENEELKDIFIKVGLLLESSAAQRYGRRYQRAHAAATAISAAATLPPPPPPARTHHHHPHHPTRVTAPHPQPQLHMWYHDTDITENVAVRAYYGAFPITWEKLKHWKPYEEVRMRYFCFEDGVSLPLPEGEEKLRFGGASNGVRRRWWGWGGSGGGGVW